MASVESNCDTGCILYHCSGWGLFSCGYEQEQELCLSKLLLAERTTGQHSRKQFLVPVGPDLAKDKEYAIRAASWGLEVCLIYIIRESFLDICWQKL